MPPVLPESAACLHPVSTYPRSLQTPCPFDGTLLRASELSCDTCKNTLPFCIVTGRHMTTADCSQCPNCHFPALHSAFVGMLSADPTCPMCGATVLPASLVLMRDPVTFLRKAIGAVGSEEEAAAPAATATGGGAASSAPASAMLDV
jgi:hypothetical protein